MRNIKIEGELKDELKDGLALINLMEVLSGEKCPEKYNTKITLDMHRIENTTIAINFITKHVGKLSVSSTGTPLPPLLHYYPIYARLDHFLKKSVSTRRCPAG